MPDFQAHVARVVPLLRARVGRKFATSDEDAEKLLISLMYVGYTTGRVDVLREMEGDHAQA